MKAHPLRLRSPTPRRVSNPGRCIPIGLLLALAACGASSGSGSGSGATPTATGSATATPTATATATLDLASFYVPPDPLPGDSSGDLIRFQSIEPLAPG